MSEITDFKVIFVHPDRCHICGCEIVEGDIMFWTWATQTYSYPRGFCDMAFKAQFHEECVEGAMVH